MARKPKVCKYCGLPKIVGRVFKWENSGTLKFGPRKPVRMALMEVGLYDKLLVDLVDLMGMPLKDIVLTAKKNSTITLLAGLPEIIPGLGALLRFVPVKRQMIKLYQTLAPVFGMAVVDDIKFTTGIAGRARIINPYTLEMATVDIAGALEGLEGASFDSEVEKSGDNEYQMRYWKSTKTSERSQRLAVPVPPAIPGNTDLPRCPKCKVPLSVSDRYEWNLPRGEIIDRQSGERYHTAVLNMIDAVFRELAAEMGDEVFEYLIEIQAKYIKGLYESLGVSPASDLDEVLRDFIWQLPASGKGNLVSLDHDGSRITIRIENLYQAEMFAGSLKGLCMAAGKPEVEITWKSTREGALTYTLDIL